MREIVPGVLTWTWLSPRFGYDFNGYYLPEERLAIDPVELPPEVLDELAARGVERIALTNRNHFRDAAKLSQRTGARVAVHDADRAFVESKGVAVAEALSPGGRVGPFEILAAPGKSPGEVALHWPARRLLLIGDACVGPAPGRLGLLPDAVIDDKPRLYESLRQLATLDVDTLLLADGHSLLGGARAALEALVG
jgi:glyoxylase-like metal-dependent hydrolase (beta-lactamase superfamily II)